MKRLFSMMFVVAALGCAGHDDQPSATIDPPTSADCDYHVLNILSPQCSNGICTYLFTVGPRPASEDTAVNYTVNQTTYNFYHQRLIDGNDCWIGVVSQ